MNCPVICTLVPIKIPELPLWSLSGIPPGTPPRIPSLSARGVHSLILSEFPLRSPPKMQAGFLKDSPGIPFRISSGTPFGKPGIPPEQ